MIANGTPLTESIAGFLVQHRVGYILSLEGPRQTNDHFRVYRSGRGSFDDAVRTLAFFPPGYRIVIRATLTRFTQLVKEVEFFRDLGARHIEFGLAQSELRQGAPAVLRSG